MRHDDSEPPVALLAGVSLALPVNSPAGQQTSPAGFAGFPGRSATPRLSTPASAPRSASDGVPRDAEGIPTVTPATVTVRRGSHVSGLAAVAEEGHGNDLAANLFSSFSLGSPASCADVAMAASPVEPALLDSSSAPAAASPSLLHAEDEAGTPEFSFFPANATSQHRQGAAQQGPAAALAITPELPGAQGQGQALDPSPEILGFYEAQARAGERGMEGNADMSGQAVEGRTMPRCVPRRACCLPLPLVAGTLPNKVSINVHRRFKPCGFPGRSSSRVARWARPARPCWAAHSVTQWARHPPA
jgi:hypothetical protein